MKFEVVASLDHELPCFTTAIRKDEKEISVGRKDGTVAVYKLEDATLSLSNILEAPSTGLPMPVMDIKYLPPSADNALGNIAICADASGFIRAWHTSSAQILHSVQSRSKEPAFTCMDVSETQIVASGYDHLLHVYDLETFKPQQTLGMTTAELGAMSEEGIISHTNRVFSCLFHPTERNIVLSGGWDRTVMVWDTRQQNPVSHLSGPYIAGDAMSFDASGDKLYTASYDPHTGLECWDFRNLTSAWRSSGDQETHLYSCKASNHGYVVCCGSQPNQTLVVEETNGKVIGRAPFEHALFDIKLLRDDSHFIVTGDQTLSLVSLSTTAATTSSAQ
ncbi:hypothetical protein PTSG_07149 [Salpingoeca rosetta]|uniref:Uncharacterized protein n=1 Tax=Salpingoeca rosetta (strain ATCC 50818 / BSB-021) TaxID=946362 RepID=F2UE72_SALR5|nr:uncharacterized protein PTSG_07149 [Salpingoeca rosetta]EGD74922.1 hypothetical protein PTSG_07149 [Salpingoeca rosetta]|eukprot:XP_004992567.1 hypothetical protein PTSG_07149 [Salpingoeca rosetta]